jgi:hypothetical protein
MSRRALIVTLIALFVVIAGGVLLRISVATTPTPRPTPTTAATSATPVISHRPGVYPWESCSAHPNPSCPSAPPTACPTDLDPELIEQFYRQCPIPTGARK